MRELHLFAGAGGGILGGMLNGHTPVCAVEIDPYCRQVLAERQDDGWLPPFPIYEDVRTFDGKPWRGKVDVVCGGFPCQPWSSAGKQLGKDDPRHLWPEMARIIEEVRPRYVFAENVAISALEEPWRDLRRMGYRVPPALCLSAADVGAPHLRKRWWLLASLPNTDESGRTRRREQQSESIRGTGRLAADADSNEHEGCPSEEWRKATKKLPTDTDSQLQHGCGEQWASGRTELADARLEIPDTESMADTSGWGLQGKSNGNGMHEKETRGRDGEPIRSGGGVGTVANAGSSRLEGRWTPERVSEELARIGCSRWWATEPELGRVAHGVANRVHRLKALGNGQVPQCAAEAWRILMAQSSEVQP